MRQVIKGEFYYHETTKKSLHSGWRYF